MTEYRLVSDHAEDLADGRVLGPGEVVDLDGEAEEAPHNERLIEEGKLIPTEEPKPKSGGRKSSAGKED